jgi:DNA helicase-2/ATP-dependent DNA helicase PcrA
MAASAEAFSAGLDDDQRAALLHDTDANGALLLSSGPGTGKTTVLSRRAARLLLDGRDPAAILGMTLTVAAAEELLERTIDHLCRNQYGVGRPEMKGLLGDVTADPTWRAAARWVEGTARRLKIATHHSFAVWILRDRVDGVNANITRLGIPEQFSLADYAVQRERAIALIEEEKKKGEIENLRAGDLLKRVVLAKARDELPHPIKGDDLDRLAFLFMRAWRRDCIVKGVIEFGDLPLLAAELLRKDAALLDHYRRRFRHFILDEFQDTTPAQMKLLKLVMGDHADLMAAGDVNQAVQTTRGTDPEILTRFAEHFPGASIIRLRTNYRASSLIHAVASKIETVAVAARDGDNARAIRRRFLTANEEAAFFADECRRLREEGLVTRWNEIAAIFRRIPLAEPYKAALESAGIPFHVMGNRDFWTLREVLEARAAWIVAAVFAGLAPPETVVERAMAAITPEQQENVKNAVTSLVPGIGIEVVADAIFTAAGFAPEGAAEDAADFRKRRNVDHLRALAARFVANFDGEATWPVVAPHLDSYLETLAAEAREAASIDRDAVILLPAPSAKGLEWEAVFLPALEEGIFPSDAWKLSSEDEERRRFVLDEEQRLFYVALTRARRFLYLTHAYRRTIEEKEVFLAPSRFLKFIPKGTVDASDAFAEQAGAARWKSRLSRFKAWMLED